VRNAFADRALLTDKNTLLFEQNCKRQRWKTTKSTIVGTAKVMSYIELLHEIQEKDKAEALTEATRGRRKSKRNKRTPTQVLGKRSRSKVLEEEADRIRTGALADFCSVLCFN
jgi:hypothetical protein